MLIAGAVLSLAGFLGTTLGWPLLAGMPGLLLASLGIGFAGQAVKVTSDTVVQRAVSDDHRGRVFSLYDVAVNVHDNTGGNVFSELLETVKVCSLGQITQALFECGGQYRRNM